MDVGTEAAFLAHVNGPLGGAAICNVPDHTENCSSNDTCVNSGMSDGTPSYSYGVSEAEDTGLGDYYTPKEACKSAGLHTFTAAVRDFYGNSRKEHADGIIATCSHCELFYIDSVDMAKIRRWHSADSPEYCCNTCFVHCKSLSTSGGE